jgi:glycosyltransferase involved in cell wall biosynthesis
MSKNKRTLLVVPAQNTFGGVYNFYKNIEEYISISTEYFYLGGENIKTKNKLVLLFIRLFRFRSALKTEKYDLVIINPSLNLFAVLRDAIYVSLCKYYKIKEIVFWRGWDENNVKYLKFPYSIISASLLSPAATITLYSGTRKTLKKFNCKNEIYPMTTVVSDLAFNYSRLHSHNKKEFKVLFLSRIERDKGIFDLLNAFKVLRQKHPVIELIIAGEGSEKANMLSKLKEEDFNGVTVVGYVRDKEKFKLIANCDLFVLPSYTEGMPNAVLEAMAVGLPVVTTKVGGLNDFFKDNEMGKFIAIQSQNDLIDKIETLFFDKSLMVKMSANNINFAKENFNGKIVSKRLFQIISNVRC